MGNNHNKYYEQTKNLTQEKRFKVIEMIDNLKKEGFSELEAIKIAMIRLKDEEQN